MDKSLFFFSIKPHSQEDQYVGSCAEFSFLSYAADTDLEAYQGIYHLVCSLEEHLDQLSNEQAYNSWFETNAKANMDNTRPNIPYKQVVKEMRAFVAKREKHNDLRNVLWEKRLLRMHAKVESK